MAWEKLQEVITDQLKWAGYERSLEIAKQAREVFAETSEGQRDIIEGIRAGESAAAMAMRLRVSKPVTGAALAGPLSFQSKIARAPETEERFAYPANTAIEQRININMERFYKGDTLYGYLFEQSCMANNHDPGAWVVFEQNAEDDARLYPVEVSSEEAIYHERGRYGELESLCFVRKEQVMGPLGDMIDYRHWYLYARGSAAEAIELKRGVEAPEGFEIENLIIRKSAERITVAWQEYETPLDFVPAIQLSGYRDNIKPECRALFYQAAIPMLQHMMNVGTTLHSMQIAQGFAKSFQYVKACREVNEQGEVCVAGYYGGVRHKDNMCRSCNGSGKIKQSSELEDVELLWPDGGDASEFIDLSKLAYHHRAPIDNLQYFNDQLNAYFRLIGALIFNQDLTEGVSMKTATEIMSAEDAITNHLRFMAEALENAWELAHLCAVGYAGGDPEKADVSLAHPDDLAITPTIAVVQELQQAKAAGATVAAIKAFHRKMLARLYKNDAQAVADGMAFESHRPWADKEAAQAFAISQSRAATDPKRVLFECFAEVVEDVKAKLGTIRFSQLNRQAQKREIAQAVQNIIDAMVIEALPEPIGIEQGFMVEDETVEA
jgi:hypothetical protein